MMTTKTKFSPLRIIKEELSKLRLKEAQVIEKRFGLSGKALTLASIGRELNLSRERVRQIEKEALRKLSANILIKYEDIIKHIMSEFESAGGILIKPDAAKKILDKEIAQVEEEKSALDLFIRLLPDMEFIERHNELHDSWVHASVDREEMIKILNLWVDELIKSKKPAKIDLLINRLPNDQKVKMSFLLSLPKVSRKIIETYQDEMALSEWAEFNPKTVRDKIYYVLKKNQTPMHFSEITRAIKQEQFDNKKVIMATVHNELIADKRFVLIGRGIYALTEWGYKRGTVKEIIMEILKSAKGAMELTDIYKEVLKQRMVRKNTVLINLQTQKEFKKLGSNKYILA